jgi:hypothetical protein
MLCLIPFHAMMSLGIPPKVIEALLKICRAFLWKGRCEIDGVHCLVAWDKVDSPKALGGLGIPNLRLLNLALCCRWAWLQKVGLSRAWAEFNIQLPSLCTTFFDGAKVAEIAPNVDNMVSMWRSIACSVKEGLASQWLRNCGPDMGEEALPKFFLMWRRLANVHLTLEREGVLLWRWSGDSCYSTKSAYGAFFAGQEIVSVSDEIWRSRAP